MGPALRDSALRPGAGYVPWQHCGPRARGGIRGRAVRGAILAPLASITPQDGRAGPRTRALLVWRKCEEIS